MNRVNRKIARLLPAPYSAKTKIDSNNIPAGGYRIERQGTHFQITAENEQALFFGGIRLLEEFGFRHLLPGSSGRTLPTKKHTPTFKTIVEAPAFPYRGYHVCGHSHYNQNAVVWMAANRMSFKPCHNPEVSQDLPKLQKNFLTTICFGHSYAEWIPREDFFESHPDFFPLIGGKRAPSGGGQLCFANPLLKEILEERIGKFMDRFPEVKVVSFMPNDGLGWCECSSCQKRDTLQEKKSKKVSTRVFGYTAELAKALTKKRPDRFLGTGAYNNYSEPPEDLPLMKNVAISLTTGARCLKHALTDPSCPSNREYLARTEAFTKKTGMVIFSEYYFASSWRIFPLPILTPLQETYRHLAAIGVKGVKSEVVPGNEWDPLKITLYGVARLLWNPESSIEEIYKDFTSHYFGKKWKIFFNFYYRLEETLQKMPGCFFLKKQDALSLFQHIDLHKLYRSFHQAYTEEKDPVIKKRIRTELSHIRIWEEVLAKLATQGETNYPVAPGKPSSNDGRVAFELTERASLLSFPSKVFFSAGYDDTGLHLRFVTETKNIQRLQKIPFTPHSGDVFLMDGIEVFLVAGNPSNEYFQFAFSPAGHAYSSRCTHTPLHFDTSFQPDIFVKNSFSSSQWICEVTLPWKVFNGKKAKKGEVWHGSFCKKERRKLSHILGGWPSGGAYHSPKEFGSLTFL